jgi:hypothetical protein
MDNSTYDIVVTFYKDGKFIWETDPERSTDDVVRQCNKVYSAFGDNLDWEIGFVSVKQGNGIEDLTREIERISVNRKTIC